MTSCAKGEYILYLDPDEIFPTINNKQLTINNKNLKYILHREPKLLKKLLPFLKKYQKPDLDYIAVTVGPGLEPALWVGVNFARALSYWYDIPILPINHIEAHICANWLKPIGANDKIFPAIALVVSGGHTQLILVKNIGQYKIVGETRDDAAGEAFDKVAKMLNLGYPGGPIISRLAKSYKLKTISFPPLPRPMLNSNDFDFSFSGLKTAVLYLIKEIGLLTEKQKADIAREFEEACVDVLVTKTLRAAAAYGAKTIVIGGGVSANTRLRQTLASRIAEDLPGVTFYLPKPSLSTDNALMIAVAGALRGGASADISTLRADGNWRLS